MQLLRSHSFPHPKISIVVPSFNQASYLPQTLDSILNQNYSNLELIVIDGGSTDGSVEIIKSREDSIAYWCSEPDGGHVNAIIKGMTIATGDIMAWLNSDDFYFPWTLSTVSQIFSNFSSVEWITGRGTIGNSDGIPLREEHDRKNKFSFLVGDYGWIQQESTFWRRSLWLRARPLIIRHSSSIRLMTDSLFWCCFYTSADLYNLNACLASYRQHTQNRAETNARLSAQETEFLISSILWPSTCLRVRSLSIFYRCFRQILSLYPVRVLLNTHSVQVLVRLCLCPPPFCVIVFSRDTSSWFKTLEPFFFKLYRPHTFGQLFKYLFLALFRQEAGRKAPSIRITHS